MYDNLMAKTLALICLPTFRVFLLFTNLHINKHCAINVAFFRKEILIRFNHRLTNLYKNMFVRLSVYKQIYHQTLLKFISYNKP